MTSINITIQFARDVTDARGIQSLEKVFKMKTAYQIDSAHSGVHFSVRHLMLSNVRGTFSGVKGTIVYDPENPSATQVDATVDAATLSTGDPRRDDHLKTADFFDVAQYPEIAFKAKRTEKIGDGEFKVTGDLTIHGTTREVTLNVDNVSPEAKDPWGGVRIGATAKTKIDRQQFGITWNSPLETGGVMIGDEVKLELDLEFTKVQAAGA
jgi:polyisoprenoid-binding protein YceI